VYSKETIIGFILVSSCKDNFVFSNDDCDVVNLFSYNMGMVWERQCLYDRVDALVTVDPDTGIHNKKFFVSRLDEEIKRAALYQRPCGLLVIEITNWVDYKQKLGLEKWNRVLKGLLRVFKDNLRPIDILGRMSENRIGIVLIERNKRQCNYVGTRIKEASYNFLQETVGVPGQISFAIAENPIDGSNAAQLLDYSQSQFKNK